MAVGVLCLVFSLLSYAWCSFLFCSRLPSVLWLLAFCVWSLVCLAVLGALSGFVVFLVSCDCGCSVPFPHGVMGWSAVCNCGIF